MKSEMVLYDCGSNLTREEEENSEDLEISAAHVSRAAKYAAVRILRIGSHTRGIEKRLDPSSS